MHFALAASWNKVYFISLKNKNTIFLFLTLFYLK